MSEGRPSTIGAIVLGLAALLVGGCAERGAAEAPAHDHGTAAPGYVCPMHPAVTADAPSDCPECGMALEPVKSSAPAPAAAKPAPDAASRYHCPMHPTYVADRPGDCPICGMRLVPIRSAGDATSAVAGYSEVNVPAGRQQAIGVRAVPVERRTLSVDFETVGRVEYDESRLTSINTKIAGWIEVLHVDRTGQHVSRGEPLLEIYAPELVATQEEYVVARESLARLERAGAAAPVLEQARSLLGDATRRLELWDVTAPQIDALADGGAVRRQVTLVSPASGHVIEKQALLGLRVEPGQSLFRVADLSKVWVLAELYESQLERVSRGTAARVELPYSAGRVFSGRVDYVYPFLDPSTRTVKVRIVVDNPDLELRPEMYAEVRFETKAAEHVLAVPNEAIQDTGERHIAFVRHHDGTFEPRELSVGLRTREYTEVRSGLVEGEQVVTSGNFLIDSESRLKSALASMAEGAGEHAGHGR